ncbi:MAG: hypothetical protein GY798_05200 [Hyphomicrobiales bacterium]|nr:hypothetical protein [Hyphomicrobiales bacterium]
MKRLLASSAAIAISISSAPAFQKFEEYRIPGNEIRSVDMAPQGHEDPAVMILVVGADEGSSQKIEIESDFPLDRCMEDIETIVGANNAYVQMVVDMTAPTMNGVLLTECSIFHGLHSAAE